MAAELSPATAGRNAAEPATTHPGSGTTGIAQAVDRMVQSLVRHWLLIVNGALFLWAGLLPLLAPVLMHAGVRGPAVLIYRVYSAFCHQLPERSWFLFGRSFTPTLGDIQAATGLGAGAPYMLIRQFMGNADLGWKLAWSDRMVSFYGGWLLFGIVYALVRSRQAGWRGIGWKAGLLLLLPMAIDGGSHSVSDLWGVGLGFRDSNLWLAAITGNWLPAGFYSGDAWGSFNSLARLVTGLAAAAGLMLWLLPIIDRALGQAEEPSEE